MRLRNFESDPLQLSITLRGDAAVILKEVRRLRELNITAEAHLEAQVMTPNHAGRMRRMDVIEFPVITDGEGEDALRQVDSLARQTRIDANTERRLDDTIEELARWTGRAKRR